jgi:6-phosphogluconate dehydrogenase
MAKVDIGVVGLGTMGGSIAKHLHRKNFTVAVYDRNPQKSVNFFLEQLENSSGFSPHYDLASFVQDLPSPKKILLMIPAGKPIDDYIAKLQPLLEEEDIIIDAGNSHFEDTQRRQQQLFSHKIHFLGVGVSGGKQGALYGASIMPGGSPIAWTETKDILTSLAAKGFDQQPCCSFVGDNGAGHFVKMVHNGIEYGQMQLIAELYLLMKNLLGMSHPQMQEQFSYLNQGDLASYLLDITIDILGKQDDHTATPLIESISDIAGEKGTGMWTVQTALQLGIAIPTIASAVFTRAISKEMDLRQNIAANITARAKPKTKKILEYMFGAYQGATLANYCQGLAMIDAGNKKYHWDICLANICHLWSGGCIIRAHFLEKISHAVAENSHLLASDYAKKLWQEVEKDWRKMIVRGTGSGIPLPAFSASLAYLDLYRQVYLPTNLIQAQRDYFGSHGFQRRDQPGTFHYPWRN